MKKVFLFLTATAFGFASMANGGWTHEKLEGAQTIKLLYNEYGDGDNGSGEKAFSWQGGNTGLIEEAVEEALGDDADGWALALGQQFSFHVKGTCNATGKLQTGLVDEQKEAGYFFQNSAFASPEIAVTKDVEFTADFVYTITGLATDVTEGFVVDGATLHPTKNVTGLVLGFKMADYATAQAFNDGTAMSEDVPGVKKVEFNFTEFKFEYMGDLSQYTKPYAMTYQSPAENAADGFQYQASADFAYNSQATTSDFFNFEIKGTASQEIGTLMIALWDASEHASPKPWATSLCEEDGDGMATIKANIAKGETFEVKGSLPIKTPSHETERRFQVVFMALSQYEGAQIVLDLGGADNFEIGADKGYGIPQVVAVEEIAAADAIVNGVIYSEGAIVIYNQAGQKVAAASQEFAIASLGAGIYFAQTAEGSFSFVVK
jgi:hypothetical protein